MQKLLPAREEIVKLLAFVSANEASDLHLKVDYPRPVGRTLVGPDPTSAGRPVRYLPDPAVVRTGNR